MTEVRRVMWPDYEGPQWSDPLLPAGIAGSLELFFWAWVPFQELVEDVTGHRRADVPARRPGRVRAAARRAGARRLRHAAPVRARPLGDRAGPSAAEIEALREFLQREGTLSCPRSAPRCRSLAGSGRARRWSTLHHGDALVPRQQRFGGYTRVAHAGARDSRREPLRAAPRGRAGNTNRSRAADDRRAISTRAAGSTGVANFNFHLHLPHYAVDHR